jgi:hypothetical protein
MTEHSTVGELVLLVPEAPPAAPEAVTAAPRQPRADALRIGLLDNSKANADHLLRLLTERLAPAFTVASVVNERKGNVALAATDAMLTHLTRDADLVVSAMAD